MWSKMFLFVFLIAIVSGGVIPESDKLKIELTIGTPSINNLKEDDDWVVFSYGPKGRKIREESIVLHEKISDEDPQMVIIGFVVENTNGTFVARSYAGSESEVKEVGRKTVLDTLKLDAEELAQEFSLLDESDDEDGLRRVNVKGLRTSPARRDPVVIPIVQGYIIIEDNPSKAEKPIVSVVGIPLSATFVEDYVSTHIPKAPLAPPVIGGHNVVPASEASVPLLVIGGQSVDQLPGAPSHPEAVVVGPVASEIHVVREPEMNPVHKTAVIDNS